jgi:hypothetical protein
MCAGDTYLLVDDGEEIPDKMYNLNYMGEDGNCN